MGTISVPVGPRPPHDGLRHGVLVPGDDDPDLTPWLSRVVAKAPYPTFADLIAPLPPGAMPNPFLPGRLPAAPPTHPCHARIGGFSGGGGQGHLIVTAEMIARWHEASLAAAMRHAAENPYDWSEPRPANRMLFTDHPLIQWDILERSNLLTGTIRGTTDAEAAACAVDRDLPAAERPVRARMWRPIAARPITNQGRNRLGHTLVGDALADYDLIRGDGARFTLALPFAASERTRQLVFFMVDWTAWRDWETVPSARQDAARYPRWDFDWSVDSANNLREPRPYVLSDLMSLSPRDLTNPTNMLVGNLFIFEHDAPSYRNPEKSRVFIRPQHDTPTSSNILYDTAGPDGRHNVNQTESQAYRFRFYTPESTFRADLGFIRQDEFVGTPNTSGDKRYLKHDPALASYPDALPRIVFHGLYGADRNANHRLDRGPLPPSVRLRAVEVARLNFYDPRLAFTLR